MNRNKIVPSSVFDICRSPSSFTSQHDNNACEWRKLAVWKHTRNKCRLKFCKIEGNSVEKDNRENPAHAHDDPVERGALVKTPLEAFTPCELGNLIQIQTHCQYTQILKIISVYYKMPYPICWIYLYQKMSKMNMWLMHGYYHALDALLTIIKIDIDISTRWYSHSIGCRYMATSD